MKKKVTLIFLIVLITGCTSSKVNFALKLVGVYDDEVKISRLQNESREVVFIPMHHVGTKAFYADVSEKIDSLERLGYHFYTEQVRGFAIDTVSVLKLRKLTGVPFSKKGTGYLVMIDSLYSGKVKYKKELVNQPKYKEMGVDSLRNSNVDVTITEIINYYENKYGEIKLEPCDYETAMEAKPTCKGKSFDKKQTTDAILNFRNEHILAEFQKDPHTKIAIIYGAKHFIGIKEELLKLGYK